MISLPNYSKPLSTFSPMITDKDLTNLKERYFDFIIDNMDYDGLCQLAWDALSDSYKDLSWDDVTEEIKDLYDEETLIQLIPEA